jgi:choline-glycine betaine transporter
MKPLILIACFLPLAVIWLVMKFSLWIAAVNEEQTYVREDSKRPHGPYVENAYGDVDEEEENY